MPSEPLEREVAFIKGVISGDPAHLQLLIELRGIQRQFDELSARKEELIDACINAGHSERAIGSAAGMSGPAIHYRKKKLGRNT